MNVKELTDKELLDLYKKNSSEIINLFLLLNAKENFLIVRELKNRGLFNALPQSEKIKEEYKKIADENTILLEEELKEEKKQQEELQEKVKSQEKEKERLKETLKEYVLISYVINSIDKGKYLQKRDYDLSNENIEELDNLYMTLINGIHNYYKTESIFEVHIDKIFDYSTKFLDRNYKAKEQNLENEYELTPFSKYF